MPVDIQHLSLPVSPGITGELDIQHVSLPVSGAPQGKLTITHISIPMSVLIVNQVVIIDNYNGDRPFTAVQVSNAELFDLNPTVEMRFTDPFPLTFAAGALVANETGFIYGIDPTAIWIRFDIEYFCVAGRNIVEPGKEQLLTSV